MSRATSVWIEARCLLQAFCFGFVVVRAMPPKKKAKASKAISSGEGTLAAATKMGDVCPLMLSASECIESMFSLRHSLPSSEHSAELPHLALVNKKYPWPVLGGGTFKQIAQTAWSDRDELLSRSLQLLLACGLMDPEASVATLKEKFCTVEVGD